MHFIKTLLAKYTGFFKTVIAPLGPWGVFVIATVDSAFMGIPMDPVVAGYVWADKSHFYVYCLMASVGSALGSLVIYFIGEKGEEALLEKRIPARRLEKIRRSFERQEFLAVMIPAMLPPPTPFKLIVLSAGALKMKLRDFMLAIFIGRMLRFTILSILVIKFGPQIVDQAKYLIKERLPWLLLALAAIAIAFAVYHYLRRRARREAMAPMA